MRIVSLSLLLMFSLLSAVTVADEKKVKSDPAGTWEWTSDVQGTQINSHLHLDNDDGKVTGTYSNDDIDVDIENGKFDGKKVTFDFELDYQGTTIEISFEGTPKEDTIEGSLSMSAGGQSFNTEWKAERATEKEDVVGTWELEIARPDGDTTTPKLTLELKDGKLTGVFEGELGEADASEISLTKNKLSWKIETDYNGTEIALSFSGIPRGSKITGTVEYEAGDQSGESDFTGKLKKKEK